MLGWWLRFSSPLERLSRWSSARADAARIRGIGRRWRNWWASLRKHKTVRLTVESCRSEATRPANPDSNHSPREFTNSQLDTRARQKVNSVLNVPRGTLLPGRSQAEWLPCGILCLAARTLHRYSTRTSFSEQLRISTSEPIRSSTVWLAVILILKAPSRGGRSLGVLWWLLQRITVVTCSH